MPERQPYLFEGREAAVSELGESAAQIVGSNRSSELLGISSHN